MPPPAGQGRERGRPRPAEFTRAWLPGLHLALTGLFVAAFITVPRLHAVAWALIGIEGLAAMLTGIALHRPIRRTPWLLLAAGLATFVVTDAIENSQNADNAFSGGMFPSPADLVGLVAYPLAVAGFWLFLRSRHSTGDWAGLIDALTVTVGLGLLAWTFLIWPTVNAHERSWTSRTVSVSYVLGDVLLLGVLVGLMPGTKVRPTAVRLLALGTVGLLTSDVLFELYILHTAWHPGRATEIGWIVFFSSWGLAALHPSMTHVGDPGPYRVAGISRPGLVLLTVASLVAPAVLLVASLRDTVRGVGVVAGFAAVSSVLVLLRLAVVIRSYRRTMTRERVLRQVGTALVAAVSAEEVAAAVKLAGATLAAPDSGVRVALLPAEPAGFAGPPDTETQTLVIPLAAERAGVRPTPGVAIAATGPPQQLDLLRDVLEILAAQTALALSRVSLDLEIRRRDNEAYFRTLVHNTNDVIMIIDEGGRITYASPSARRLLPGGELIGATFDDLVGPDWAEQIRPLLTGARPGPVDWLIRRPETQDTAVEVRADDLRDDETVGGVVLTLRDVTEQRRLERELRHHAYHDSLTGLSNRRRLQDRIDVAVQRAGPSGRVACLLLLDLDDFKDVNDTKGHGVGDELLAAVADRLSAGLRPEDVAARLGGDEFAVLMPDTALPGDGDRLAERITRAFDAPFELTDGPVSTGASIGVASTSESPASDELLRNADLALYAAKADGKRRWRHYDPALHDQAVERAAMRENLARAVLADAVTLHYQPVVELGDGRVSGFEALARWPHPARGPISPDVFIPLAEDTGQIIPLGRQLLRRAVTDAAAWNRARAERAVPGEVVHVPPLTIAVNVSIQQFRDAGFAGETAALLEDAGFPPELLTLELTESDLMHHRDDEAMRTLSVLKARGVRIAIDDFGTGYSSLSYLRDLPIDILKIDKSFIDTIPGSSEHAALVEGIIRIADALGLRVVAEGVETQEQWNLLGATDCDFGQGFLFGAAMSADRVADLLAMHRDPRLPLEPEPESEPELDPEPESWQEHGQGRVR